MMCRQLGVIFELTLFLNGKGLAWWNHFAVYVRVRMRARATLI